jgi:hypothetical protein
VLRLTREDNLLALSSSVHYELEILAFDGAPIGWPSDAGAAVDTDLFGGRARLIQLPA